MDKINETAIGIFYHFLGLPESAGELAPRFWLRPRPLLEVGALVDGGRTLASASASASWAPSVTIAVSPSSLASAA